MFLADFLKEMIKAFFWSIAIVFYTAIFSAVCIAICLLLCLLGIWNWAGLMLGAALLPWAIYLLVCLALYLFDWLEYVWAEWCYARFKAQEAKK